MRVFAFFFLATILASCTSAPDPDDAFPRAKLAAVGPMSSLSSPQLAGDRLVAADGATLPLRRWLPEGRPRAVVLALHGFNDYSNAFAGAGAGWAKNGIATYAYDQRGFGAAPGRGRWPVRRGWPAMRRPPRSCCASAIPAPRSIFSAKAWAAPSPSSPHRAAAEHRGPMSTA